MNKILALLLLTAFLTSCGHNSWFSGDSERGVASTKSRIEEWSDQGIRFVIRSEEGLFESYGTLRVESWNDGDNKSEWIARREDGTLVTGGYKGNLEKFKLSGFKKERNRLVIRNSQGHFVTWKDMDAKLDASWSAWDTDRDGKKDTVYVIRYNGKFINWAKAKQEDWDNYSKPVLVVRDSSDDDNNGKLLSWIAPQTFRSGPREGQVYYKHPVTKQFLSANK
jgi:hypothetical protein